MPPLNRLTGAFVPGVQELDGVHGGPRSEAKCQAKLPFRESSKARASRPWSSERLSQRPRRILSGRLAELADRDLVWRRTDRVVLGLRKEGVAPSAFPPSPRLGVWVRPRHVTHRVHDE